MLSAKTWGHATTAVMTCMTVGDGAVILHAVYAGKTRTEAPIRASALEAVCESRITTNFTANLYVQFLITKRIFLN